MKLLNPTDDELNAAFAERVAGWTCRTVDDLSGERTYQRPDGANIVMERVFTQSADAVLPWLEKRFRWECDFTGTGYQVWVSEMPPGPRKMADCVGSDKTFPRAAVIALLRAHGVEVEFTQTTTIA